MNEPDWAMQGEDLHGVGCSCQDDDESSCQHFRDGYCHKQGDAISAALRAAYEQGVVNGRAALPTPAIDLKTIQDPNFTAGMNPNEYLERLHEGTV